jgi:two-component system, LytTR family, response regulator
MNLRAILIDDERKPRELLKMLLRKHCPEVEVIAESEDAETGLSEIRLKKPDLVFLDINLKGDTGIQMLKRTEKIDFEVIFVTGHDQFALDALRLNAVDYILKPPDPGLLKSAVKKAGERINAQVRNSNIVHIINIYEESEEDKFISAHVNEIIFAEAINNYTSIQTGAAQHVLSKSLGEIEEMLSPSGLFIRISKSILINAAQVKQYSKDEPAIITMNGGREFEASRRKKTEVLAALKKRIC